MKISILIYSLGSGGAERVVSILLKELKGYEIELILMNDNIFYDVPKNVKIVYLEKSNPFESGIKKFLKLPLLGFKYKKLIKNSDVSISFMNRPNYINVFAKLFGSKVKTIISERAMPSLQHKKGLQGKINKFLIKRLYKKADLVISNSKGNKLDLEKNFNISNVKVIYNFIEKRKCKRFKKDEFIFISIGRLDEGKNHKLLINAFYRANLDAKLFLIGDGYLRGELEELVRKLNLEKKVFFLGRQKNVFKYLQKASCFVFSSDYEGFPNVLLEALVCNLPIISTDCKSGPREILAPNTNVTKEIDGIEIAEYGILTKVGSIEDMVKAMKMMYEDDKLRYNFEKKSQERIKDFEVEKIIKKWEEIINE
jgi:N-acetylgalactosamine-N,N'-diacetylbacillosaminyl-diphospho-undecaprenol 4-alpha-N-acetylgalactosaminyltransferase